MAGGARRLSGEEDSPAVRRAGVERAVRWRRRRDRELIDLERPKLRGDHVGGVARLPRAGASAHRILARIIESAVVEYSLAVHLRVGDIGVPVRDVAPAARPG